MERDSNSFTTLTCIILSLCYFCIENLRIRLLICGFDCDDLFGAEWCKETQDLMVQELDGLLVQEIRCIIECFQSDVYLQLPVSRIIDNSHIKGHRIFASSPRSLRPRFVYFCLPFWYLRISFCLKYHGITQLSFIYFCLEVTVPQAFVYM